MSDSRSSDRETIQKLRDDNAALNEQIKLLVKTEQRLYRSQNELDREFSRVRALAEFALHCAEIESTDQIINGGALLLHGLFDADEVTFACLENEQTLASIHRFRRGEQPRHAVLSVDPLQFNWLQGRREATISIIELEDADAKLPQRLTAVSKRTITAGDQNEHFGQWCDICVPLRSSAGELAGLFLVGRKIDRGSYFKEYADWRHLPYLELLASHLARAVQNAQLTEDLRRQGRELAGINRRLTRSLAELEASETRFRELAEHVRAVFWIMEPHSGRIDYLSPAFRSVWGRDIVPREEATRSFVAGIHKEDRERVLELRQRHLAGETTRVEYRIVHPDGGTRWIWDCAYPVRDEQGRISLVFGVAEDITTLKQTTEEIGRLQRLETAGQIAGQIAHDFNNLLAPLTAYPQLLRASFEEDSREAGMLETMQSAAKRIADINQQLLALGRRGHYDLKPIDLNVIVREALHALEPAEGMRVETELEPTVLPILGGASQLTRVIVNLGRNALDAKPRSGSITIRTKNVYFEEPQQGFESVERGEFVLLEVIDDGVGIPESDLERIFDPFYSTKEMDRKRGSGLGLSVVHGVVADHGGSIDVRSTPEQGSTFSVYFPVSRQPVSPLDRDLSIPRGSGETVLLVDDDPLQREVVCALCESLGYRCETVESGERALSEFARLRPDLLLLDMVMGGIDGAETLRRLRDQNHQVPAILVSGYAQPERVEVARQAGAVEFLAKPLTRAILARALKQALC